MPVKIHLLSPCESLNIDGPVFHILRQLPQENRCDSLERADVIMVPITYFDWFRYNEDAMNKVRGKKWVLVDYSEFGWNWDQETSYNWGSTMLNCPKFGQNEHYQKFDQFVRENPPILTFQRELLEKDRTDKLIPIEYTSHLQEFGADTKDQFLKRPLEVSYYWGRSSEDRVRVQAEIFNLAAKKGIDVITQFNFVEPAIKDNPSSKKWLAVFAPHYARLDVNEVQGIVRKSKATIVMPGCGVKTFRHGESCGDSIMVQPHNNLAWSYPWTAGQNCLEMSHLDSFNELKEDWLYEIYAAAMDNARNYRIDTYLRRWVVGNIERCL